ncbi:hypothetical protein E4U55_001347 [Claviceps digitariae]|nr:hypothetical protein E4U55_001347 [Claviceps digitariae]
MGGIDPFLEDGFAPMSAARKYGEVRPGRTTAVTATTPTNATTPTSIQHELASQDLPTWFQKTDMLQNALSSTAGQASDKAFAAQEAQEAPTRLSPGPGLDSGGRRHSFVAHGRSYQHLRVHLTAGRGRRPESSPLCRFWQANKPAVLVALSQLFGALMNLAARFLELEGDGMHPIQMLLLRQGVTSVCCVLYMWWMKTPGFPLGVREIRWLLLLRGSTGFFGIFGMWWSMMYLPLADATVITFLAPGVAGFACSFFLREPFTRLERMATLVALLGVVLIAQPTAFFAGAPLDEAREQLHHLHPHHQQQQQPRHDGYQDSLAVDRPPSFIPGADHQTTPQERVLAVGVSLLGVLGAAGAFTTLRAIGKRAHPLISVNAFAVICTIICATCLALAPVLDIAQPSLRWVSPTSMKQWLLLLSLGVLGFVMQYLLTAGLGADKSNRANAMVYTHMLFAVSFDRWIFGHQMGPMSFAGCTLIMGSAVSVILVKGKKKKSPLRRVQDVDVDVERRGNLSSDGETSPMLVGEAEH